MKALWVLYRKELRSLAGAGIGLILAMNFGGLLHFISYIFPEYYQRNQLDMYPPVSVSPNGLIEFVFPTLLLYAVISSRLKPSKLQEFSLPYWRSAQLLVLFAAATTWVTGIFVFAFALDTVYAIIHTLLPSLPRLAGVNPEYLLMTPPRVHTMPSYRIVHIVIMTGWAVVYGARISGIFMVGYIAAAVVKRILRVSILTTALIGILVIILSLAVEEYLYALAWGLLPYIPEQMQFAGLCVSKLTIIALMLFPVLFLYERYGEV